MATLLAVRQNEDATKSAKRCDLILRDEYRCSLLKILDDYKNADKRTFCYLMQYHINIVSIYCSRNGPINHQIHSNIIQTIYAFYATQYFIKILEDQTHLQPIAFAKKLMQNSIYKQILQKNILIPEFAGDRTDNKAVHIYEIVQYKFVNHVTLHSIAIRMLQTNQLNSKYFLKNISAKKTKPWKNRLFKLKMLHIFKRVIEIVIDMNKLQLIDLDTSPDNFIIKTAVNGAAQWKEIIPENCFKIDHESVIEFTNGCLYAYQMYKPMKPEFTPPEITGDIIRYTPQNIIQVEPFSVYQIASIFIMILFGQVNRKGIWYTLGADFVNNQIIRQVLNWNPKQDLFPADLTFLSDCVSLYPSERPSLRKLLQYVLNSIEVTKSKNKAPIGNYLPKKVIKKTNNLHRNGYNNNYNTRNNYGRVRINHQQQQSIVNNNRICHNNRIQRQINNNGVYEERRGRFHVIRKQSVHQQTVHRQTRRYNVNYGDENDSDDDDDDDDEYNNTQFSNNSRHKPRKNKF